MVSSNYTLIVTFWYFTLFVLAVFNLKIPIFGPTWTWNDTWMWQKSAQHTYYHWWGCVLAHYPDSRLIFSLKMASCHFGCFLTQKYPFLDPTGPGITPGWGIKVSNISFPIVWGVLWHINRFPGWFFTQYGALSFWLFLDHFWTHLDLGLHLNGG